MPDTKLVPSLLTASDVLDTGWSGAVAADVQPGKTVAVVGDGAVGLLAVLAAQQLGADQIIAFSRHEPRQKLARQFGATDIVTERGDDGVARIKDLTNGLGAHCVIEAVGTQQSMMQAIWSTRPGGHVGYVGVSHDVSLPGQELFYCHAHLHGGPAPGRRFPPDLINRVWTQQIDPGKVFDLTLPSIRSPRVTRPWTSAAPSRRCWNPELRIFAAMQRAALSPSSRSIPHADQARPRTVRSLGKMDAGLSGRHRETRMLALIARRGDIRGSDEHQEPG